MMLLWGCDRPSETDSKILMDTLVEIKTSVRNEAAVKKAFEEMERIDNKFSAYKEGSEVFKINSSKKTRIGVDDETRDLIRFALDISSASEGAFDITVFPLIKLWDIKKLKRVPSNKKINLALCNTGYQKISLSNGTLRRQSSAVQIDLGGFVKGYAVDKAVETLKKHGVKSALVNAGGDIRVFGDKYWKIGIQHPRKNDKLLGILTLKNKSIVTSGDYERFFIKDNKRFCHIINPKTGYPSDQLISVTVISDECVLADALATAVFVLGPERGLEFIKKQRNTWCIIVDNKGEIFVTGDLKKERFNY